MQQHDDVMNLERKVNPEDYKHIKGWGIDADPENDPVYPIKNRTNEEHKGYSWPRPPQQPATVEVLHSNERPNLTAVFGTTCPPKGLSGRIRRWAFQYGEGSFAHWIPLIVADRVDMIEGVIDDLKQGHVPNIIKERGWTAEWKYNREEFVKKLAIGAVITVGLIALLSRKSSRS